MGAAQEHVALVIKIPQLGVTMETGLRMVDIERMFLCFYWNVDPAWIILSAYSSRWAGGSSWTGYLSVKDRPVAH